MNLIIDSNIRKYQVNKLLEKVSSILELGKLPRTNRVEVRELAEAEPATVGKVFAEIAEKFGFETKSGPRKLHFTIEGTRTSLTLQEIVGAVNEFAGKLEPSKLDLVDGRHTYLAYLIAIAIIDKLGLDITITFCDIINMGVISDHEKMELSMSGNAHDVIMTDRHDTRNQVVMLYEKAEDRSKVTQRYIMETVPKLKEGTSRDAINCAKAIIDFNLPAEGILSLERPALNDIQAATTKREKLAILKANMGIDKKNAPKILNKNQLADLMKIAKGLEVLAIADFIQAILDGSYNKAQSIIEAVAPEVEEVEQEAVETEEEVEAVTA